MHRFIITAAVAIIASMLTLTAFIEKDHVAICNATGALMLSCYIFSIKFGLPYYRQPHPFVIACSKPMMMLHRGICYFVSPENLIMLVAPIVAIFFAPIPYWVRFVTMLMVLLQSGIAVTFNVMVENISKDKQSIRKSLQWSMLIGTSLIFVLTRRSDRLPEFLFYDTQWWVMTIGLAVASAILYPFAKRWVL